MDFIITFVKIMIFGWVCRVIILPIARGIYQVVKSGKFKNFRKGKDSFFYTEVYKKVYVGNSPY